MNVAGWGVVFFATGAVLAACAAGGETQGDSGSGAGTATGTGGATSAGGGQVGGSTGGAGQGGTDPNCMEDPCKLTEPQCGCPGGEQCTVLGDVITCAPEGDIGPGEACGAACVPGYLCVSNLTGGNPICHKFCDDDAQCSAPGGLCVVSVNDGLAKLCSQNCDPVTDTGCLVPTMKCDIAQEATGDMRWFTRCTGAGALAQGEICTSSNQCDKGLGCFGVQGSNDKLCLDWCTVATPNCPVDTQCASFTTPILVGTIEYGACVPIQ